MHEPFNRWLARAVPPFVGIPGAGCAIAALTLLIPFVAIRTLDGDKENGGLKLLLQLPHRPLVLMLAKLAAAMAGWLLALVPALSALVLWATLGGHLYAPETLNLLLGHLLYGLLVAAVGLFAAPPRRQRGAVVVPEEEVSSVALATSSTG